ncbi:FtsK/SpoIIIE family protein [Gordonia effusa NBRC 100432]|uniref:FtsK/SpoIIIE family protein n=1 Tax=Gordonia effusa NBRC 100432 TaxID=1077974 RepID=H0QY71_9ACTN|nr:type VII secretion protein EccCb [Gordonia effusa]GAB17772.1 FtsK/SpoIIIE family protein [Gordonia effusa NBRC 100432]
MAARVIHRPARTRVDPLPKKPLDVSAPPTIDDPSSVQEGIVLRLAMPLMAGGGMMLMMASTGNKLRMVAGIGFIVVALLMGLTMYLRSKTGHRKRAEMQRTTYIKFLTRLKKDLQPEIQLQREVQLRLHPAPNELLSLISNPARLYERRRWDPDFGMVRVGTGAGPLARDVNYSEGGDPAAEVDQISVAHLERTKAIFDRIDGIPLCVELSGTVSIIGSTEACESLIRAALTQYLALHAPEDAAVHLCIGSDPSMHNWIKFAPHLLEEGGFDGPVHRRRATTNHPDLHASLSQLIAERAADAERHGRIGHPPLASPFIVIVVNLDDANGQQPLALFPPGISPATVGICVLTHTRRRITEPSEITCRVEVSDDGQVTVEDPNSIDDNPRRASMAAEARTRRLIMGASKGSVDRMTPSLANAIAHELASVRLAAEESAEAPLESTVTIEKLLRLDDIGRFDPIDIWRHRPLADFLKVPFGIDTNGNQVFLDLKESALEGHGPHGLCIGATGSGKSEVLRTLVLAQAINHPPERLAFILVDYKGGAAFNGLDILPHTAAMVDNLGDSDGLVDRLHDAMSGEMQRRQRVLQAAGAKNIYDYNDRRDAGAELEPLPNLLVIIDEFGEILVQKPEFLDLFVQIGRIGRSIGIHLLLASQRLEEGRLRGLESHLSYRICLRTFSAVESRIVIGTVDAHELPALPGSGYLKVDPDVYVRFKAAYVSGRYEPLEERVSFDLPPLAMPYGIRNTTGEWLRNQQELYTAVMKAETDQREESPFDKIALEVAAERMGQVGRKVKQIWLPPLRDDLSLTDVVGNLTATADRGLQVADTSTHSKLRFPIGTVDDPAEQWQGTFYVDTAASNVLILGAPQTGKTTTARAMVMGSAVTHTPRQVAWYVIDAASTLMGDLEGLPHVGGVATRFDPDKIRRAVAETTYELARREELFVQYRISSIGQMRRMVAEGAIPEITVADRYLMIDGWATFNTEYETLVASVTDIAVRGLGYGLHVIIVANRLADLRTNLNTNLSTMIEHRLANAVDSMISRPLQNRIGAKEYGRVITPTVKLAQIINATGERVERSIEQIRSAWRGAKAPIIRMLPERITYSELTSGVPAKTAPVILGIDEATLSPLHLDILGDDPHLTIFGEGESGKTNLLRAVVGDIVARRGAAGTNIVVIDPRRSLLDAVPQPPLVSYDTTREQAATTFERLHKFLSSRLPGNDVTPAQLRSRSWWTGPEVFVIVDDYDLLVPTTMTPNPLSALIPLIPHARDIGLHVIITRKTSGLSRALFDPVLTGLRDNGGASILLSGDRSEGQIFTKVYLQSEPPGRGRLIRRGNPPQRAQYTYWPEEQRITATAANALPNLDGVGHGTDSEGSVSG